MSDEKNTPQAPATDKKPASKKNGSTRKGRPSVSFQPHKGVVLPTGFVPHIAAPGRRRIVLPGDAAWLNDANVHGKFTGELVLYNCYGHYANGQPVAFGMGDGTTVPAPSALVRLPVTRENRLTRAEFDKLVPATELGDVLSKVIANESVSIRGRDGKRRVAKLDERTQKRFAPRFSHLRYTEIDERAMSLLGDDRGQWIEFLLERAIGARSRFASTQENGYFVGATHRRGNIQGVHWGFVNGSNQFEQAKALLYWERPDVSLWGDRVVINAPARVVLIDADLTTILLDHTARQVLEHAPRLLGATGLAQSPAMAKGMHIAALQAAQKTGVLGEVLGYSDDLLKKVKAAAAAKAATSGASTASS